MDASQINRKINAGRGKVASKLGLSYSVFRPLVASDPLTNKVDSIKASFNAGDGKYLKPNMPGDPIWFGDFDGSFTSPGDYLVSEGNPSDIKFIAAQQFMLPIIVIDCNRSIRISRSNHQASGNVGAIGYSGICDSAGESTDALGMNPGNNGGVFVGWPCSMIFGKGKLRNADGLPGAATDQMGWMVYLPSSTPIEVKSGDRLSDDLGRMFVVNGAEQSDIGWRINAIEAHP